MEIELKYYPAKLTPIFVSKKISNSNLILLYFLWLYLFNTQQQQQSSAAYEIDTYLLTLYPLQKAPRLTIKISRVSVLLSPAFQLPKWNITSPKWTNLLLMLCQKLVFVFYSESRQNLECGCFKSWFNISFKSNGGENCTSSSASISYFTHSFIFKFDLILAEDATLRWVWEVTHIHLWRVWVYLWANVCIKSGRVCCMWYSS